MWLDALSESRRERLSRNWHSNKLSFVAQSQEGNVSSRSKEAELLSKIHIGLRPLA